MHKFYAALAALILSLLLLGCTASATPAPAKSGPDAATQVIPDLLKCANNSLIFPLPQDARDCASVAGGAAFKTQLKPEEVIKFYRDFFGSDGWTLLSTAEAASVTPIAGWLKGNTTVQLIAFPQQGGGSSVNINVASTQ
jgi:hypothetical protein